MITYVNTVLVGTGVGTLASAIESATAGQYVVVDNDGTVLNATTAKTAEAIKVGLKNANGIKWSNIIKKDDLKSYSYEEAAADTNDEVEIDCSSVEVKPEYRYVIRVTYKDLPTRYRKWSDSYEVSGVNTVKELVDAIVAKINGETKRARVIATSKESTKVVLTAMSYDDDNTVDSISPAAVVRFGVNMWYTDPTAAGFASKNKYATGAKIEKTPGKVSTGSAKYVRDLEAQAMGYQGILNRGEGTWPIIKPGMNVDLTKTYDSITLEFENMYHAADDINRKTKQCLQIFEQAGKTTAVKAVLDAFVKGEHTVSVAQGTKDTVNQK